MRIREAIVVEGRYDRARVLEAVDTIVVETAGFGIFNNREQRTLLRLLAQERGLIVLTDSDSAGAVIRSHLSGLVPKEQMKHAYCPIRKGKERRKSAPSKARILGVEGVDTVAIQEALVRAGATVEQEEASGEWMPLEERGVLLHAWALSKQRMMADGLSGGAGSALRRRRLLERLGLPQEMSANRLREVLEITQTEMSYCALLEEVGE